MSSSLLAQAHTAPTIPHRCGVQGSSIVARAQRLTEGAHLDGLSVTLAGGLRAEAAALTELHAHCSELLAHQSFSGACNFAYRAKYVSAGINMELHSSGW